MPSFIIGFGDPIGVSEKKIIIHRISSGFYLSIHAM